MTLAAITNLTLPVKATPGNVTIGSKVNYSYNVTDSAGTTFWTASTNYIYTEGDIAFCIEPALLVDPSADYQKNNYSAIQRDMLEKISYVGWALSNKTSDDYFATQLYIWEYLGTTINSTSFTDYASKKALIKNKVDKLFGTSPSFNENPVTLNIGESKTITDTNGVFEYYGLTSKSNGIDVSQNGNKLTIFASSSADESSTVKYQLIKQSHVGTSILYTSPLAQDVVAFKVKDPKYALINIKVNKFGSLKLAKQDEDGTLVPNTSFKLSYNNDMSSPIGTYTTGSDGSITVDNLDPKTIYVQETAVPDHLVLDNTIYSITVKANDTVTYTATNNWIKGKVKLKKADSENSSQVAGATYAIYDNKGQELQRLVTTASGFVESGYLRFGSYTVKEVIAPTGYVLNDTVYPVQISSNEQKVEIEGTDRPIKGYIQVEKLDADSGKTITKANATFSVYQSDGTFVQDITTDASGKAITGAIRYGNYYLIEKTSPDGYTHSDQKITYEIREDGKTYTATLSNKRVTGSINISKVDSVTGNAQGEATLQGAAYGLYAREPIVNPADGSVIYAVNDKIAELTTDGNGKADLSDLYLGKYYLKEISASNGYTLDTNEYDVTLSYADQNTVVITGSQTVKERVMAQAFSLIKISDNGSGETDILKGVEFTIKAQKDIDAAGSWEAAPIAKNAQGQEAAILVTDEKGYAVSEELPFGTYVVRETKVPDDLYQIPDFTVVINKDSRDAQPWRIFNDEKFKAVIAVVKKDATTNEIIALKGAKFKIKNLDTNKYVGYWAWNPLPHYVDSWTTDQTGTVMTGDVLDPGNYQLEEVTAPEGYTLNTSPVKFTVGANVAYETLPDGTTPVITVEMKDTSVKGKVKVYKEGEVLTSISKNEQDNLDFHYEVKRLKNAVFEIYAKEDVMSADHQGKVIYKKDTLVDTVTTEQTGTAISKELPLGSYYVKEKTAPNGFTQNNEIFNAELTYKDQNTSIVFTDAGTCKNERQKVSIEIMKLDADTKTPLYGASFGIYAKEDIKSFEGTTVVKKDTLLETVVSNDYGEVSFKADYPLSTYYIKEIKAPIGYASSDKVMNVDASYQGQNVPVITYKQVFENSITKVNVSKKDITNDEEIAGASMSVYPKDEPGAVFASWISGSDGKNEDGTLKPHLLEGLEPGVTYVLHEVSSPYGFAIASDVEFAVKDTGKVQTVEMKDEVVMGSLTWNKTGEIFQQTVTGQTEFGTTESPVWSKSNLLGAEITIYAAEDIKIGNTLYYKSNEEIEVLESDWDEVESKQLPVGRYYYVETKVPHGYIVDTNKHYFEIEDNQKTEVQMISSTLANTRATVTIDMTKVMEKQDVFKNTEAYQDVVFGIYAREDIYDYMGNVALPYDTMITTSGINEDGHLVNVPDLPNGVYYMKELATNEQYVLDTHEYDFEIGYHGSDVTNYIVHIGENSSITNELARGEIQIKKVDTFNEELKLKNVAFQLSDKEDMSEIISTTETDEEGIAKFSDLELGTYYVQETKQVDGYVRNDHIYKVEVKTDKDVLEITCENKPTEVVVTKLDEDEHTPLPGAKLQILEKETGQIVEEWTSDKEVHKIIYLVEGVSYILHEEKAPYGYQLMENVIFQVRDGMKLTAINDLIRKDIRIDKVEAGNEEKHLRNAVFDLYEDQECINKLQQQVSDENGLMLFNDLPYGTYYVRETKAPDGYELDQNVREIKIDETYDAKALKWTNKRKIVKRTVIVHSGDVSKPLWYIGGFTISGFAIFILLKRKKAQE